MINYCRDVRAFHDKFELETPPSFTFLAEDLHQFRVNFFNEELHEFLDAIELSDPAECVDALIDLVYITCGAALLHGIDEDLFTDMLSENQCQDLYPANRIPPNGRQVIKVERKSLIEIYSLVQRNIHNYKLAHVERSASGIKDALSGIYFNSLAGAKEIGFDIREWNELWNDVQRANLSKERAKKAEDSKRGSKWDVIKPVGWIKPKTLEIVNNFIKERK